MSNKAGVPAENTLFCAGGRYEFHYAAEPFEQLTGERQPLRIVFNDNGYLFPSNAGKKASFKRFRNAGTAFNWLMKAK